ncbi:MAG: hypothetical protein K9H16_16445, partial [Bacteroidales bacterium]|nr:hypothetical protein [Bacteroidales bacterium]
MKTDHRSGKFQFVCTNCGRQYDEAEVKYLCPDCEAKNTDDAPPRGVLKVIYDYEHIRRNTTSFAGIKNRGFLDLLPINDLASLPGLRVGHSPFYNAGEG